jgi:hypothetical protein
MWFCTNEECPEYGIGKEGEPPEQWPSGGLSCGWCWEPCEYREPPEIDNTLPPERPEIDNERPQIDNTLPDEGGPK